MLLVTTGYSVPEVAQMCSCDSSLVRRVRRRLHNPFPAQTNDAAHAAMREEIRALKATVEKLTAQVSYLMGKARPSSVQTPASRPSSMQTARIHTA